MKTKMIRKTVVSLLAISLMIAVSITCVCCKPKQSNTTHIKLTEVAHSIFYAPMYVAIENGYFDEEGIDLELVNGFGADKVMSSVISGDTDIGFCGPEASIYLYAEGAENYVINIAQLTQRAGNFLVARKNYEDFNWSQIKGHTVIGGRKGGMPELVFEYVLKKNGIDSKKDVTIIQNIDFGSTAAAFSGGTGDFTIEFEPSATALEQSKDGYVVRSLGVDSGYIPYTSYCVTKNYLENNKETLYHFTKALQKGMIYVNNHTPAEIANIIAPQFKDFDLATIKKIVKRYHSQNTWKDNLIFEESAFDLLQSILLDSGELKETTPYEKLIDNTYSKEAAKITEQNTNSSDKASCNTTIP